MQARAADTRQHLVRTAAQLIDTNGLASTGLNELLSVAGVTKGAFYFHFPSKAALLDAVSDEASLMAGTLIDDLVVDKTNISITDLTRLAAALTNLLKESVILRAGLLIDVHTATERAAVGRATVTGRILPLFRGPALAGGVSGLKPGVNGHEVIDLFNIVLIGVEILTRQQPAQWSEHRTAAMWSLLERTLSPCDPTAGRVDGQVLDGQVLSSQVSGNSGSNGSVPGSSLLG